MSNIPPLVPQDLRVKVGRFSYGSPIFRLWSDDERIEIGAFCSIADDVYIFGGGEHNANWVTTFPLRIALGSPLAGLDGHPKSKGPTRIGNDVWIGHGATILSGVTVGDGVIIGARAVVSKDVPPYHVVAGNPAVYVRSRFTAEQIDCMTRIKWWDWPLDKIKAYEDLLCSPRIDDFIKSCEQDPLIQSD
ncbi:CatB-related O-acetyltransferase [Dyella silvatica]|uniref:CatB-related O-acetyltransferase n=1 Tax=Dyella silvatica TaxID=2992128 RepID=UPI002257AB51|nr:CatB-related O-acetyltransferase [Dyella silvatica]